MDGARGRARARGRGRAGALLRHAGRPLLSGGEGLREGPARARARRVRAALGRARHQPGVAARPSLPGDGRRDDAPRSASAAARDAACCSPGRTIRRRCPMAVPNSFLLARDAARRGARPRAAGGLRPRPRDRPRRREDNARRDRRRAARHGRPRRTPTTASRSVYAKSWGSLADYGKPEAEAARRAKLEGLARDRGEDGAGPATRSSCTACRCAATSSWTTRSWTGRAPSFSTRPRTASTPSRRSWSGWQGELKDLQLTDEVED